MLQVVVEKDTEYQFTDRVANGSITLNQRGQEYTTINKKNWIGHILLRNCLLKHVIEELRGR